MSRRVLLSALAAILLLAGAAPARAFWSGDVAGAGAATVDTLAGGTQPTVTAVAQTVTVQWTQTSFEGAPLGTYSGGGYIVRRYPAAGGAAVTPGTSCSGTITGSTPALSCQELAVPPGAWRYSVTPVLASWTGAESVLSSTVDVAPIAPILASATAQNPPAGQTTGAVQLDWVSVTGATGYNVYRRTVSGSFDFSAPLNGAVAVTATSYTDPGSGLTGGTTYVYAVRAVTASVESANSNEVPATAFARPSAPTGVTAVPAPAATIAVGWSSVAGATGYNIYRRTVTGAYDYTSPLNGATVLPGTSYSDTATVNGTSYRYVIRAVSLGAGGAELDSVDSTESATATADGTSPASVSLTNPGSPLRGSIALSGTATDTGSGIASLRFQYTAAGGSTWTDGCTSTTGPYSCTLSTTSIADGLYDLRVLATDTAGNTTASSVVANRRIDNTGPTVSVADPGAYLRGTATVTATASDAGSGLASLRIQRAPTGSSTWTDVCTTATSPASCALNTATLPDGGIDLRAIATDQAGNTITSTVVANRIVDNTAPTAVDVQTTNGAGGTAAKPNQGDTIIYTFSEPMLPASIMAGWTGAATPVVVRFTNGNPDVVTIWDATNTTQIALGSFTSGKKYVTGSLSFTASSLALSGTTVTVTLGVPTGTTATANGTSTLQWTTSTAATDRAGNPLVAGTIVESGAADLDF